MLLKVYSGGVLISFFRAAMLHYFLFSDDCREVVLAFVV